jgi:hypothetical protein
MSLSWLIVAISLLAGCASNKTLGELKSGYTYIPIDPFSVQIVPGKTTNEMVASSSDADDHTAAAATNAPTTAAFTATPAATSVTAAPGAAPVKKAPSEGTTRTNTILDSLPDNTIRMAVETLDANGTVSYGPAAVSAKGSSYKVTIDYVNSDTANVRLFMCKSVELTENHSVFQECWYSLFGKALAKGDRYWVSLNGPLPARQIPVAGTEAYFVRRVEGTNEVDWLAIEHAGVTNWAQIKAAGGYFYIPVYIGIGLRVTANITSAQPNVNISGVGSIGATKMSGSLVVQTLGINGETISPALPIQTELNQSTVQNSIVSIASIKTHLYDAKVTIVPRVVGLYLPFSGGKPLVNAIISQLSKEPVKWQPPEVALKR